MNTHKLKIKSGPFAALASGAKTGEVRNCSDRNFQVGDTVELRLIDETGNPTGQEMHRRISHIQTGYGLPEEICVLSYEPLSAASCPGHGRSECVSCCWPKGELQGKRADVLIVDEFGTAPVGYTAVDMGTAASEGYRDGKSSFVVTLPRGDSLARRMYGPGAGGENPLISRADAVAAIEAAGGSVAP
jgi:hypothetical protein